MKKIIFLLMLSFFCFAFAFPLFAAKKGTFGIVVHGGAGTILKQDMKEDEEKEYRAKLTEALKKAYEMLDGGGPAIDAVQIAINVLEDSPLFNAGKGAVFNAEGKIEMDASIMDGRTLNAGAVAGVRQIRNPINLARLVMEKSKHVMLSGRGAEKFAIDNDIKTAGKKYFFTKKRWEQLKKIKKDEKGENTSLDLNPELKYGTVGAVALDQFGNLASGTSTGGLTNKRWGRVGDSPIIGAGTYANNNTCAISATGTGEYFIRGVIAHDISAMMEYGKWSLAKAAKKVIMEKLTKMGGDGGIIGIDNNGNITMVFTTEGMYRGNYMSGKKPVVEIYKD